MSAWQRSNVTVRNERGFGSLSFKRLLFAGSLAAITIMFSSKVMGFAPGCGTGLFALILALVLTHPTNGIPLIAFVTRNLRGLATVASMHGQANMLAVVLQVKPGDGQLQAEDIYDAAQVSTGQRSIAGEWMLLPGGIPDTSDTGMMPLPSPFDDLQEA